MRKEIKGTKANYIVEDNLNDSKSSFKKVLDRIGDKLWH